MYYVIYSREETEANDGEPMYWSNDQGWVSLYGADVFTQRGRDTLNLPLGDAVWQPLPGKVEEVLDERWHW